MSSRNDNYLSPGLSAPPAWWDYDSGDDATDEENDEQEAT